MKYQEIITQIDNKVFQPVYFLMGEESYYIDKICDYICKNTLNSDEKEFNQIILYGKEIDVSTIISEAKQFPFGAEYRVVIIKEAQDIRSIDQLESYLENPNPSTILVICFKYKKIDKRKSFGKNLSKKTMLFESKKLYENQIPSWIKNYIKELGYSIDDKSSKILSDYLGTDLSKISNEINKLILNIKIGEQISPKIIEENIGISKDYNIFEFQNALGKKDILKSNRIIKHFSENPKNHPFVLTLSSLFSYFQKIMIYHNLKDKSKENIAAKLGINPFFVYSYQTAAKNYSMSKLFKIFTFLKEYDLKSKGVNNPSTNESELLKELTFKILH
ncbi:MAG: DNA polymerase III subunit delta [Flavobacteriales bacterium]|nr:DNA polymerase III subunit delta [Flavobacteriales bacterium]|tara:strand:+ start:1487 stop:2485 length:999 start_codon:yes stop_codon:yes gene_type:complete